MNNINSIIETEAQRFAGDIKDFTLIQMGQLLKELSSIIIADGNAVSAAHSVNNPSVAQQHILEASAKLLTISGVARAMHERIAQLCETEGVTITIQRDEQSRLYIHTASFKSSENSKSNIEIPTVGKPQREVLAEATRNDRKIVKYTTDGSSTVYTPDSEPVNYNPLKEAMKEAHKKTRELHPNNYNAPSS
jgi:hypothetical protein